MQIFTMPDGTIIGPFDSIQELPDGNYFAEGGIIPANQVTGGVISTVPDDYLNPEQQAALDEKLKAECKLKASELLYATDWTTIPDVASAINNPYLTNQADFIAYRNTLRQLAVYPVTKPVFPTAPTSQWSS
jgi:hypothetical protein